LKTLDLLQRVKDIGKSTEEKQKEITVAEVWHLYKHLSMRYEVLETTQILKNYVKLLDFRVLINYGINNLQEQVSLIENFMNEYGIPLPERPPIDSKTETKIEIVTDRFIFRRIFRGIQSFIPDHANAYIQSTSPKLRELFKKILINEIYMYDKFVEYGKIRGFEYVPPMYRK
jgi:spore coat protein CotF